MITLHNYLSANGKYPEREKHPELTQELLTNADHLLMAVSNFLSEIGINPDSVKVSSGFRPSEVNAATKGAAKSSYHTKCLAIDMEDISGDLYKKVTAHPEILRKYGLFAEARSSTPTWTHLDLGTRPDRPSRIFNP